jgi:hypothetical protein
MSGPSKSVQSKIPGLEARIAELHRELDRLITEHVCDVAEDISGCPTTTVRSMLVSRSATDYCSTMDLDAIRAEVEWRIAEEYKF